MSRSVGLRGVRIRGASLADAAAIAAVHVQAWHETYCGLVPEETLAALSVEENTRMWRDILASPDTIALVAERAEAARLPAAAPADAAESAIVGFGAAGSAREQALGADGEVTAIYLLDRVKRRGIGRALFAGLMRALAERGHRSAGLWVLASNVEARRFYEGVGGRVSVTREDEHSAATLHEIAYVWDDLAAYGHP